MRALLLLFGLVAVSLALPTAVVRLPKDVEAKADKEHLEEFYAFIDKFNRIYTSEAEITRRFDIFKANLVEIEEFRRSQPLAQFGVNKFSDYTHEEKLKMVMTAPPADLKSMPRRPVEKKHAGLKIPETIDWRDAGIVTSVKDQGQCGSCWTFGSAALVESAWAKRGNKPVNISEQEILDCVPLFNFGCNGGTHVFSMNFAQDHGLVLLEDYTPYHAEQGLCHDAPVYLKVKDFRLLPSDETEMAEWIAYNDPIAISFKTHKSIYAYTDGVFDPPECEDDWDAMHCVLIVGYTKRLGQDVWIVKNSWGSNWGVDGYFYMARGKNTCAVDQFPLAVDSFQ